MRLLVKVVIPFVFSIVIIFLSFLYFVYPSLSTVSAFIEMGDLKPAYKLRDKVIVPGEIVNISHRPSYYLIVTSIYSPAGAALQQEKLYYLEPGQRQRFFFEICLTTAAPLGRYRFLSKVKIKLPGRQANELARVIREFEVTAFEDTAVATAIAPEHRAGGIFQRMKPTYLRRMVRFNKGVVPLSGDMKLQGVNGTVLYGATPSLEAEVKNTSSRRGEFKVVFTVTDPAGLQEDFSYKAVLPKGATQVFSIPYPFTEGRREGIYTFQASLYLENNANPEDTQKREFLLVDIPPELINKTINPARKKLRDLDFQVEVLDDKEVQEVHLTFRPENFVVPFYYKMECASGDKRSGIWSCKVQIPKKAQRVRFSFTAIDSKLQRSRTPEYLLGGRGR